MNKFLSALLIIVIVLIVGFLVLHRGNSGKQPSVKIMPDVSQPDPSNATFSIEDENVTLKNGKSFSDPSTETDLTKTIAYGDVNGDGHNDTVALLLQSGGGSGEFVYLVAYVSGNVEYKGSNAVFIGDRVSPQSLSVDTNGMITLNYLDRAPNDPMAAEPTIPTTKHFKYINGTLEEI